MRIASYGAGTNSTAKIIEMHKRGIIPDLILFGNTGCERPETYDYIEIFNQWLTEHGMPQIITVQKVDKDGNPMTLEQYCLKMRMLPSLAYGFKICSQKFKTQPQEKFCNHYQPCIDAWKRGEKVIKVIGYDYGEERRATYYTDKKWQHWYPLIEWEIDREQCQEIICKAGLPQPGKSSCFFCPSMKKHEIFELRDNHPDLLRRALELEAQAENTSIVGLGRSFSWKDLIEADANQIKMFSDWVPEITCNCYDG